MVDGEVQGPAQTRLDNLELGGLTDFWRPQAVTVVGASPRIHASIQMVTNLRREDCGFEGRIHLVNHKRSEVFGAPCHQTVGEIGDDLGLLILMVPAKVAMDTLTALEHRPTSVMVYADDFDAGTGSRSSEALRRWSLENGVPVLGPSSSVLVNGSIGLFANVAAHPDPVLWGRVGLIGQSGGLTAALTRELMLRGVGVSTAVGYGRGTVLCAVDLALMTLAKDDVDVVAIYAEVAPTPAELRRIGVCSQVSGKPAVLFVPGTSSAGQLAARSHTGALATSRRVLQGVARQFGIVLVDDPSSMLHSIEALVETEARRIPGHIGIFATSGGAGVIAADAVDSAGLPVLPPPQGTVSDDGEPMPNPFDAGTVSMDDPEEYGRLVERFSGDQRFGTIVGISGVTLPTERFPGHVRQGDAFIAAVKALGKQPVMASPVEQAVTDLVRREGVLYASGSHQLAAKLRALAHWGTGSAGKLQPDDQAMDSSVPLVESDPTVCVISGLEVEEILAGLGLSWPATIVVSDVSELDQLPFGYGEAYVAKTVSGVAHRASRGGVLLGLATLEATRCAVEFLRSTFGGDVSVSRQVTFEAEYFVGFERTADGPIIAFGTGGAELGTHTAMRLAPTDELQRDAMVGELFPEPSVVRAAFVHLIAGLEALAMADPTILSVDMNPIVIVGGTTLVSLDAKIHREET